MADPFDPEAEPIADLLVCVRPQGVELTDHEWQLVVAEWRARKARGQFGMLEPEEVLACISRGAR